MLIGYIWIENYVDEQYQKIPYIILIIALLGTGIILKIPFKWHHEIGYITFNEKCIQTSIYKKTTEFVIKDLDKIVFDVVGYYGQEYMRLGDLPSVEGGTGNFITLYWQGNLKKTEFLLSSQNQLHTLRTIAKVYEGLTEVKYAELH